MSDQTTTQAKPVTKNELQLLGAYIAIALFRQIAHDLRNIVRWARGRG